MFRGSQWPWRLDTDDECDWHVMRDANCQYVSDACVEGTTEEWRAISKALRAGEQQRFKRVGLSWHGPHEFSLCSPRNTMGRGAVLSGHAKANELADIIDAALSPPTAKGTGES
jgi:hypothetical protein